MIVSPSSPASPHPNPPPQAGEGIRCVCHQPGIPRVSLSRLRERLGEGKRSPRPIHPIQAAFSLLELTIVISIISLVIAMATSSGLSVLATARLSATTQKMAAIDQALMAFRAAQDRIPCPANLTIKPTVTNYGVEAATPGVCTGGTPAANFSATSATSCTPVVEGAVPTVTLGLPSDFMYDGWGNRFRYAVDVRMTQPGAFSSFTVSLPGGAIQINDANGNARTQNAAYALISHGPNGHGAYTSNGVTLNGNSSSADELTNCHCTSAGVASTYTSLYVQKVPQYDASQPQNLNYYFDDIVTYKQRSQMMTLWDVPTGNVYFSDSYGAVRQIAMGTGVITTYAGIAGTGNSGYNSDNIPANTAKLNSPFGLALDNSGNLYIADRDNNRIRMVTASTGIISTIAGTGSTAYNGDGIAATSANLHSPYGVAADSSGNIYIADTYNGRIRMVAASTGIISTVAGGGTSTAEGVAATTASLSAPDGVAVDSSGNIYIADTGRNRIRMVSASTQMINTVAGGGASLASGVSATTAKLFIPESVVVDSNGNMYIADNGNSRICKVSAGILTTIAGNETAGYTGDGGPATSAEINAPWGLALDSNNNVYIGSSMDNTVRKVSAGGMINTIASINGRYGASGDGGQATCATTNSPVGIAVGSAR